MYDRLIRHFQSPAERKEEAKKKGYAGALEADLWRGEAKLEALRQKDGYPSSVTVTPEKKEAKLGGQSKSESDTGLVIRRKQMFDFINDDDEEDEPRNKADGEKMWRKEIERRFVAGRDEDFEEYDDVDDGRWDDGLEEEREEEERWFDEEEERWVSEEEIELDDDDDEDGKLEKEKEKNHLKGETGVQDF